MYLTQSLVSMLVHVQVTTGYEIIWTEVHVHVLVNYIYSESL